LTLNDVKEVTREVQAYWGSHLYVRVVPEGTPCMDWKEVLLPETYRQWSRERLISILLHEWGHRMISPISPQRGAVWCKVAEKAGLSAGSAKILINIATDLWLDRAYLENPDWQAVYRSGTRADLVELAASFTRNFQLQSFIAESTEKQKQRLLPVLLHGIYEYLLLVTGKIERATANANPVCSLAQKLFSSTAADLYAEVAAVVGEMYHILFDGFAQPVTRIGELAQLLKDWLGSEEQVIKVQIHEFSAQVKNSVSSEITEKLHAEAIQAGLSPSDLEQIFGRKKLKQFDLQRKRLKLYAQVVPVVKKFLRSRAQMSFAGYRGWHPGQPLKKLDLVATIQRSSWIIPSITTVARRYERKGFATGRGNGGVVIVIDDSGSTDGNVLQREKEAAFAVIAAARSFQDAVAGVVFGSEVTASKPFSNNYLDIENTICSLDSNSGGTYLANALREAYLLAENYEDFSLMIMTDAEVDDVNEVMGVARRYPLIGKIVMFCFNEPDLVAARFGQFISPRFRVFAVSPDQPFAETALEEIYG